MQLTCDKAVFLVHFIGLRGNHFLKTVLIISNPDCFVAMYMFFLLNYMLLVKGNNIIKLRKSSWFLHDFPQYVHSLWQIGAGFLIIKEKALTMCDLRKKLFRIV